MHPFLVFITIVIALWAQGTRAARGQPRKPPPRAARVLPKTRVTDVAPRCPFVMQDGVWYTVH